MLDQLAFQLFGGQTPLNLRTGGGETYIDLHPVPYILIYSKLTGTPPGMSGYSIDVSRELCKSHLT